MSRITFLALLGIALALLVVGLALEVVPLAVIGLFGAVALVAVQALAAGGDWIRDASAGRFKRGR